MKKDEFIRQRERVRTRLVVWVVLTICFQILTTFHVLAFLEYVVWLATAYCGILIILWCYFEVKVLKLTK